MFKPDSTRTLIFAAKIEKIDELEFFENLLSLIFENQPQMTGAMQNCDIYAHFRIIQSLRNISALNRKFVEDVNVLFRTEPVRPQAQTTAKHKWSIFPFGPKTKSLLSFLKS